MNVMDLRALVLSGGSYKGYIHLGALCVLEEEGYSQDITLYAGTSIGALIGFLLCCGISPKNIMKDLLLEDPLKTNGISLQLFTKFGLSSMKFMRDRVEHLIAMFSQIDVHITFGQLLEQTGKTLICCATKM